MKFNLFIWHGYWQYQGQLTRAEIKVRTADLRPIDWYAMRVRSPINKGA